MKNLNARKKGIIFVNKTQAVAAPNPKFDYFVKEKDKTKFEEIRDQINSLVSDNTRSQQVYRRYFSKNRP